MLTAELLDTALYIHTHMLMYTIALRFRNMSPSPLDQSPPSDRCASKCQHTAGARGTGTPPRLPALQDGDPDPWGVRPAQLR